MSSIVGRFHQSILILIVIGHFNSNCEILFAQQRIGANDAEARSRAVVVDNVPLLHTRQILPNDVGADGGLSMQVDEVFTELEELLKVSESKLTDVVKLNVYVRDEQDVVAISTAINQFWDLEDLPAVMWVQTPLPIAEQRLGIDAVAIVKLNDSITQVLRAEPGRGNNNVADWSILPAGRSVYIAGQAEPGQSLAEATTKTLESLHHTLEFMELGDRHVVQIKTFLNPMTQVNEVDEAIAKFYSKRFLPPVSHVEWGSAGAIEIEMIAFVPDDNSQIATDDGVVFLTPPSMTSSPVFSRIAAINATKKIYISGLTARGDGDGEHEVRDIYSQLSDILHDTGSDLRHLVKATYYVSDNNSSNQLNALRPMYYDPKRPPSASKAPVKGVGFSERTISIDMIAVPVK